MLKIKFLQIHIFLLFIGDNHVVPGLCTGQGLHTQALIQMIQHVELAAKLSMFSNQFLLLQTSQATTIGKLS